MNIVINAFFITKSLKNSKIGYINKNVQIVIHQAYIVIYFNYM